MNRDLRTRLRTRCGLLSLAASLFFLVGLVTVGTSVEKTEDAALRAASWTPFAIALGSAIYARVTRAKLSALRPDGVNAQDTSSAKDSSSVQSPAST
jgi:hypothetical protein